MPQRKYSLHFVTDEWNGEQRSFRAGVICVGFRRDPDARTDSSSVVDAIMGNALLSGGTVEVVSRNGWFTVRGPWASDEVTTKAHRLVGAVDEVEFAHPDFLVVGTVEECGKDHQALQWGLAAIDGDTANGREPGKPNILIGIVDSGVPLVEAGSSWVVNQEDLEDARFVKPGFNVVKEFAETTLGLTSTEKDAPEDLFGHGTEVTGVIAARDLDDLGAKEGILGMNSVSPVLVCRALEGFDFTDSWTGMSLVALSIDHIIETADAMASGSISSTEPIARIVINLSLVLKELEEGEDDDTLRRSVEPLAERDDVILVCGSGKDGDDTKRLPALYSLEFSSMVLAVGGTQLEATGEETRLGSSNYGTHISLVAPGGDILTTLYKPTEITTGSVTKTYCYDTFSGTSFSTAFVTGVVSLVWSMCPNVTAATVIDCMKAACENIPERWGKVMNAEEWGAGRINADFAVPSVKLITTSLVFANAEPGTLVEQTITLEVHSCMNLNFSVEEIVADPGAQFQGNTAEYVPHGTLGVANEFTDLVVSYRGTAHGTFEVGTARIRCAEFRDDWVLEVDLTANTTVGESLVALAVDESGSMAKASGVATLTRSQLLQESAGIAVKYLPDQSAMAIVAFSGDADVRVPVTTADIDDPHSCDPLYDGIDALKSSGSTSISDAVELSLDVIDGAGGYDNQAVVVVTDGKETAEKYISDVDVTEDVYAIGMGNTESVDVDALLSLASGHENGYLLVTGDLEDDRAFDVAKYLLQILCDIHGDEVILDPRGRIRPAQTVTIRIPITERDSRMDVIAMVPWSDVINLTVRTPAGAVVPTVTNRNSFVGPRVKFYRLKLPFVGDAGAEHAGQWEASLTVNKNAFDALVAAVGEDSDTGISIKEHGLPYAVVVHGRSTLRMSVLLDQHGLSPGSDMTLRAVLSDRGIPLTGQVVVRVFIEKPNGDEVEVDLPQILPGVYETSETMTAAGLYRCRFVAAGLNREHQPFVREQVRTAVATMP